MHNWQQSKHAVRRESIHSFQSFYLNVYENSIWTHFKFPSWTTKHHIKRCNQVDGSKFYKTDLHNTISNVTQHMIHDNCVVKIGVEEFLLKLDDCWCYMRLSAFLCRIPFRFLIVHVPGSSSAPPSPGRIPKSSLSALVIASSHISKDLSKFWMMSQSLGALSPWRSISIFHCNFCIWMSN